MSDAKGMQCRKCGKQLSGMAAQHAYEGGDKLCGLSQCFEENQFYQPSHDSQLRDQFAGLAMQSMISALAAESGEGPMLLVVCRGKNQPIGKTLAKFAYEYADFMMEARKQ